MSVSWETFERYRQKGLDARRAMQWDTARLYLLEAARAMTTLAKEAQGDGADGTGRADDTDARLSHSRAPRQRA